MPRWVCGSSFMTATGQSTTGVSDSAQWMTTNMEYGKFYHTMKIEGEEWKSLHAECQKRCEALTKELRDCQAQLELLRLRTLPKPTAEGSAASPPAYGSVCSRSISPKSYLEDHLKMSEHKHHEKKESETEGELMPVHSGKVKELGHFSGKARDTGKKEKSSVKARDLEIKEEIFSEKKKGQTKEDNLFHLGRREECHSMRASDLERQTESCCVKKTEQGRKEDNLSVKSRDMARKEVGTSMKSREVEVYKQNQAVEEHLEKSYKKHQPMEKEAAAMGEHTKLMHHMEGRTASSHCFDRKRIPIKRGPPEDLERMYPNKHKAIDNREKHLIQNQAPHYLNPATSRYNYYKYYGYAGQGAKTSWGHNLPLGLEPPYAAKARILPLGQEPHYSTRAREASTIDYIDWSVRAGRNCGKSKLN